MCVSDDAVLVKSGNFLAFGVESASCDGEVHCKKQHIGKK